MGNTSLNPVPKDYDQNYYVKCSGQSFNAFLSECKNINKDYKKFDALLAKYLALGNHRLMFRDPFITFVSYAVPAPETIQLIHNAYKQHLTKYPNARLVDLGAGSGIFSWLLHRAGVSKEQLIAVDVAPEDKTQPNPIVYWDDIILDVNYVVDPEDFVLVAWGYGRYPALDKYIISGGKCIVIIGEDHTGCTLPANFFTMDWSRVNDDEPMDPMLASICDPDYMRRGRVPVGKLKESMVGWKTELHCVPAGNYILTSDYLTINTKYVL